MNFFEILIVLLFIVLPLLQQVLGQRKEPEEPEPDAEDMDPRLRPGRRPAITRTPVGTGPAEAGSGVEGWSGDWGEWPSEVAEQLPVEATLEEIAPEAPPPERTRPDREVPKVVSLEPLRVDRAAEHKRFHARKGPVLRPIEERPARVATMIRGSEGLRRAVLLSEVIGLPRAFRYMPAPPERE